MEMNSVSAQLTNAGIDLEAIPSGQQQVLASLTDQEATTLASIKRRLDEAGGDVEAHQNEKYGGVFW